MASEEPAEFFRFGEFEVDAAALELRCGSTPVVVQLKVLDLILVLLRNRHRVVTKDELLESLWPDEIVAETSLTQAIRTRRVFQSLEDLRIHRFVEDTHDGSRASSVNALNRGEFEFASQDRRGS